MAIDDFHPRKTQFRRLLETVGRNTLHSLYPKDFEAYIMSLELVNSKGGVVDFFVFPVMPTSISQISPQITNIKKTAGGITALSSTNFTPIDITISGDFGRKFKFLVGQNNVDASAIKFSTKSGSFSLDSIKKDGVQVKDAIFDSQIKTGYGCIKILQSILEKSKATDQFDNPYRLFLYNPVFGDSFLVKYMSLTLGQKYEKNMIHDYIMSLKAIAPIEGVRADDGKNTLKKSMQYSVISRGMGILANEIKQAI